MSISWATCAPPWPSTPAGATLARRSVPVVPVASRLLSGSARWVWHDGGRSLSLAPGVLLLARPGMVDEYRWDERRSTRHGYVHFSVTPEPDDPPLLPPMNEPGPLPTLLRYLFWLAGDPVRPGPRRAPRMSSASSCGRSSMGRCPTPSHCPNRPPSPPPWTTCDGSRRWRCGRSARRARRGGRHLASASGPAVPARDGLDAVTALELRPAGPRRVAAGTQQPQRHPDRPRLRLRRPAALLAPVPGLVRRGTPDIPPLRRHSVAARRGRAAAVGPPARHR